MADWYERAEEALYAAYERGELTREQLNKELRELQREYREAAEEAAERAYRDELDRW